MAAAICAVFISTARLRSASLIALNTTSTGGKRFGAVVEIGHERGRAKDPIVEKRFGVERAAGRDDDQQNVDRGGGSVKGRRGDGASREAVPAVLRRFILAAEPRQRVAQPLMRFVP